MICPCNPNRQKHLWIAQKLALSNTIGPIGRRSSYRCAISAYSQTWSHKFLAWDTRKPQLSLPQGHSKMLYKLVVWERRWWALPCSLLQSNFMEYNITTGPHELIPCIVNSKTLQVIDLPKSPLICQVVGSLRIYISVTFHSKSNVGTCPTLVSPQAALRHTYCVLILTSMTHNSQLLCKPLPRDEAADHCSLHNNMIST